MAGKKRRIQIFDTTLRDGEQSPGASLNIEQKLRVAAQLARLGVDVIEAGFPASSPGDFEAVKTISRDIRTAVICGLTRAVASDIESAAEALKGAESPRIHTGLGVSDVHLQYKLRKTREEALEMGLNAVKLARRYVSDVEYFMEDAGRGELDYVYHVVESVIRAGATVINVPDTTGYSCPEEFGALVRNIMEHVPNMDRATLSVHCHNDLGMATANALAGVANGAQQVECTINGIGERAGNTSLEEVEIAIATRGDLFDVKAGIRTRELYRASRLVGDLTGIPVQPNKAIVGANAFAHSSGIHQDGVLKERLTYEIIDPRDVGVPDSEIILTARSGRHALRHRIAELGSDLPDEEFERVYEAFLSLADKKKEVYDEDVEALISDKVKHIAEVYVLKGIKAESGTGITPTAVVEMEVEGRTVK